MKVFIKKHDHDAGFWIYQGYKKAWEFLGFEVCLYDSLTQIIHEENFYLMAMGNDIKTDEDLGIIKKSCKTFLFVQPNYFPKHWGTHPNWVSTCPIEIEKINNMTNVIQWTFLEKCDLFYKWKNVHTIPLAFDDISYTIDYEQNYEFDVCYIGGWANNGFDEKKKNILKHFSKFKDTSLKCGIFINKNISHEQEQKILSSSKICLNIHDDYQREFGLDTNERTFKSLGLNGILVSDDVTQIKKISNDVKMANDPDAYLDFVYKELHDPCLAQRRLANRQNMISNHTYKNRVKELLHV
jgi:hypothetical protein